MIEMMAMAGVGLGLQAIGGIGSYGSGRHIADSNQAIATSQLQIQKIQEKQEDIRRRAMELDANRKFLESYRNQQRARSIALANANSQGGALGSGLQGGYGGIGGQTGINLLGVSQGLQAGRENFGLTAQINAQNQNISQQRVALAGYQGQQAMWQGISSFGSSLTSAAAAGGRLAGGLNFGGPTPVSSGTSVDNTGAPPSSFQGVGSYPY